MITNEIGINAGKIWNILNKNRDMSIKLIKKSLTLDDKSVYMALGWLAREDKITFYEEKTEFKVMLKED